ncbi:RagB/SusD family nutrient uptake outer membrane protein [Sphingobacterium spiritivorum]|uniref:RagB/SusD family nutrient uptake outer membrane protein n=1 Tax=Sphingobacterium spiritivorum TaxID=258 RepID=UPI003DA4D5C3
MKPTIILIIITLAMMTSCKKFLEENPKDELAGNQYFTQPEHATNAVNGLYRNGAPQLYDGSGAHYSGSKMFFGPYLTGYIDNDFKGQEVHVQHAQNMTFNATNLSTYFHDIWSTIYRGISRSNNAIKYIPTTPGLSDIQRSQLLAEAYFFRAQGYFQLVRMFGDVPLITEPYENLENINVKRTPVKEVYALIVQDLTFAVNQGNLADKTMSANAGRVSKGTAATLLADVYLTMSGYPLQQNEYAKSAATARAIIKSGVYQLTTHDRNPDGSVNLKNTAYNKLRLVDNVSNEYIYSYEFTVGIATSTHAHWAFPTTATSATVFAITNNAYGPSSKFLKGYGAADDLRIQEKQFFHSSLEKANGTILNFPTAPYMWQDDQASFETATSGKDLPIYTYPDVLLMAAEAIALSEGVTAEAVDYLSQVRARAYWKTNPTVIRQQLGSLPADQFVKEVWKERYRELVFEGRQWFDIQRTRMFPVPAGTSDGNINFEAVIGHANDKGAIILEKNLLLPIPTDELQRNPLLEQNPGY